MCLLITCMVRNTGWLENWKEDCKQMIGKNEGHALRKALKARNIWRKHHKEVKGDQYYQLGEIPAYDDTKNISSGNVIDLAVSNMCHLVFLQPIALL